MKRLGLFLLLVIGASTSAPAAAAPADLAHCTFVAEIVFETPVGVLGAPPQEIPFHAEDATVACTGHFAGRQLRRSGVLDVEGAFHGTCLAHRADGTYSFRHPSTRGPVHGAGAFTNQRLVDKTGLTVLGPDHAGFGTATAVPNASPCRVPFDRAQFTAELTLYS